MFSGAPRIPYRGLEIVLLENSREYAEDLEACRESLLELATFSRGWDAEKLPHMRRAFKLEPFHMATSLALVFDQGRLCATAGVDADFPDIPGERTVLHLCSVNIDEAWRSSGLAATILVLVADQALRSIPGQYDLFFTSISQSPLVYQLLGKLGKVYPNAVDEPPGEVLDIARRVVAKYDPHIPFDDRTMTLRNECEFFYRRPPRASDEAINVFFRKHLEIEKGDVFVHVSASRKDIVLRHIDRYRDRVSSILADGGARHG